MDKILDLMVHPSQNTMSVENLLMNNDQMNIIHRKALIKIILIFFYKIKKVKLYHNWTNLISWGK
jgi:hypothetical protein